LWFVVIPVSLLFCLPVFAQQPATKPFILPVAGPPGQNTWLFVQPYGNTVGAYNFGDAWYSAGQGLHFGVDLGMPCGTPLVAVADGEVLYVDNLGFGSAPHNLLIKYPDAGLVTLYGHLLKRPTVTKGEQVKQGQVVALSGDPDLTCESRPHLHFEVRSLDYKTFYNPVDYIDADWNSLAGVGGFSSRMFEQDLNNPRQWMSLDDQPVVKLGGARLNRYTTAWPLPGNQQPPENPPLARATTPRSASARWTVRRLGFPGCCPGAWWSPTDPNLLYMIDGSPGQLAGILEWNVDSGPSRLVGQAPPPFTSPDGAYQVREQGGQAIIHQVSDGKEWAVATGEAPPAFSTDNSRLLWEHHGADTLPGQPPSALAVWISDLDGSNARRLLTQRGGSAMWLDEARLLVTTPGEKNRAVTVSVYDTRDNSSFALGTWDWLRGLSVSPGGKRIAFYQTWQGVNGIWVMDTQQGAAPKLIPYFGAWRWRDADSLYLLPLGAAQMLYYNLITDESRPLTNTPIHIANGDWSVSPDGQKIVYLNADDNNTLWILEPTGV
jgi:hypothetical protein